MPITAHEIMPSHLSSIQCLGASTHLPHPAAAAQPLGLRDAPLSFPGCPAILRSTSQVLLFRGSESKGWVTPHVPRVILPRHSPDNLLTRDNTLGWMQGRSLGWIRIWEDHITESMYRCSPNPLLLCSHWISFTHSPSDTKMQAHSAPDARAVQHFFDHAARILGEANVSRDHQHGALKGRQGEESYGDPFSTTANHQPGGAVRPSIVEEVQDIVKIANVYKVALWTVSRGKNLGYGGSSPVVEGTVVLDLQRMNKIIEVNEEYGYAIVEPGVSFFDLFEEIQRQGMNLWPSVPAIGWGSVLGNTVDRGLGYTPNGEHSQSQCGMEVVLPNGDLLRTGSGAMKDNKSFPLYKGYVTGLRTFLGLQHILLTGFNRGFGPSLDGLFFQSNFGENSILGCTSLRVSVTNCETGVVTKLGIHITPAPEAYATVEVSVPREEDLVPLIGTLSDLMRRSIILNSPSIANIFRIALTSKIPEVHAKLAEYMKPGSNVPVDVLEEIRAQQGWGYWRAYFSLYGSVEMLPALQKTIERAFSAIPGSQVEWREFTGNPGSFITAAEIKEEEIPHSGIPTLAPLGIVDSRQQKGGGHICFSPVLPPSGRELYDWYLTAKQRTVDAKFDFFADFHVYPRYVIAIELVIYTLDEEDAIKNLYTNLLHDASDQGYMEYRTHVSYMDHVASKLDFNQSAFRRFTSLLKDTVDPNGVLSPGKSGIWNSAVLPLRSSQPE